MVFLTPDQLEDIPVYEDWQPSKEVELDNGQKVNVLEGTVDHKGCSGESLFYKMPQIATLEEVSDILSLVKSAPFDTDPDSVDGMSTHEFYIDSPDIQNNKSTQNKMKLDSKSKYLKIRTKIRKKLLRLMKPIIEERINPYVRKLYSKDAPLNRQCTPCYCFVRRYREDERRSHATHRDGHAYATVVISLNDFGKDYRGGIYVATAERYKKFVALNKGDAVVHKHDLLHGVKVKNDGGERWSWILWYKDSTECVDHSAEWFKDKAYAGIPVYQALYANVVSGNEMIKWHQKAADQGFSNSMIKLARAYLKFLPSKLDFNPKEAERLYRAAIQSTQDPHAQYGLAQMILGGLINSNTNSMLELLRQVIELLEESAKGGNEFAMFNLGIAHLYGYTGKPDQSIAKSWFEMSGLPEGYIFVAENLTNKITSKKYKDRAMKMGYGTEWRQLIRQHTGLGGAGGVDLNLPWPTLPNGQNPKKV
tara:strand:- start:2564 stop:3997 length:1434 start_codon:yes stop_codon:yes gene_type:complete